MSTMGMFMPISTRRTAFFYCLCLCPGGLAAEGGSMKLSEWIPRLNFVEIDQSIQKLKEIRDSYRALNIEIYGEELARLLNDW